MSSPKIKLASSTKAASKETLYVDVEDEITSIIDKVSSSKSNIVAVVLPKRANVMQSVVNMKLLKQTAEEAGKHVVLVTSEASLMPLAGMTGMYVAATPTSKPSIPSTVGMPSTDAESIDEPLPISDNSSDAADADFDPAAAAAVPIGVLAADEPESILMSENELPEDAVEESLDDKVAATTAVAKPNKKLKVPSFNKFRVGIVLGVLALLLLAGVIYAAVVVLPKAGLALTTNSSTVTSELNVTLDTAATKIDLDKGIIPAVAQTVSKTLSQEVPTTGQQNVGKKATGSVTMVATMCGADFEIAPDDLSTGDGVSSGGRTYILQDQVNFPATGKPSSVNGQACIKYTASPADIVAINSGAAFNVPAETAFAGPGGTTGTGSASGGTDEVIKIVAQADIDSAKDKISQQDTAEVRTSLAAAIRAKDFLPIDSTFLAGEQQISTNVNVGDKADTVKVTSVIPYSLLGAKRDDLKALLLKNIENKVDTNKQNIADDGIDKAKFSQQNPGSASSAVVLAKVKTVIGPKLDAASIRNQVAGKKAGEIKDTLNNIPGVTDVEVLFSPFWVSTVPKDTTKITVVIDGETK